MGLCVHVGEDDLIAVGFSRRRANVLLRERDALWASEPPLPVISSAHSPMVSKKLDELRAKLDALAENDPGTPPKLTGTGERQPAMSVDVELA